MDCRTSHSFHWIAVPGAGRRDRLATHLRERGISTTFRHHPSTGSRSTYDHAGGALPNADRAAEERLLLPMHRSLTDSDKARILEGIRCFPA